MVQMTNVLEVMNVKKRQDKNFGIEIFEIVGVVNVKQTNLIKGLMQMQFISSLGRKLNMAVEI